MAGDHPENDLSEFCDQDQVKQYPTIVGQLIWLSGLGRSDIAVHIMTMSRFRQQPRIGHLERLGCGYTRDEDGTLRKYAEKSLSHMKECLVANQRRLEHH